MNIRVNELFYSVQGETTTAGFTSFFIRLAGCNLDCAYCDAPEARHNGRDLSVERVLGAVAAALPFHHVTVTGGEPMIQQGTAGLLDLLVARGYAVQLETNGSISLVAVNPAVRKIVDVKTPGSGHAGSFLMDNLSFLSPRDEVKFVITDRHDFDFAVDLIKRHLADAKPVVNFSPVRGRMDAAELSGLILERKLQVRLNLQLHKIIWGEHEKGRIIIEI